MAAPTCTTTESAETLWRRWRTGILAGDDRAIEALRRLMVDIATVEDTPSVGELAVLERLALGDTYQQAADYLILSFDGVKSRADRLRRKLGARNTAHAVAIAYQQQLI